MTVPLLKNIVDPDDIDTFIMKIKEGQWIYLAVCPDDKSKISFVSSCNSKVQQLILNKKAANLIIKGLQDCIKDL